MPAISLSTGVPSKSPEGNDQWETADRSSKYKDTFRLTADLALVSDPEYKAWAQKYHDDHALFDEDFANAWCDASSPLWLPLRSGCLCNSSPPFPCLPFPDAMSLA